MDKKILNDIELENVTGGSIPTNPDFASYGTEQVKGLDLKPSGDKAKILEVDASKMAENPVITCAKKDDINILQ